jgi:hypothetical protein
MGITQPALHPALPGQEATGEPTPQISVQELLAAPLGTAIVTCTAEAEDTPARFDRKEPAVVCAASAVGPQHTSESHLLSHTTIARCLDENAGQSHRAKRQKVTEDQAKVRSSVTHVGMWDIRGVT